MIFVARCPECRCPLTLVEINAVVSHGEIVRRHNSLKKWEDIGAVIESTVEPPPPDELFVHKPGCARVQEYRHQDAESE